MLGAAKSSRFSIGERGMALIDRHHPASEERRGESRRCRHECPRHAYLACSLASVSADRGPPRGSLPHCAPPCRLGWTVRATVRDSGMKYLLATRWMSPAVTLLTSSREVNNFRQSP